MKTLAKIMLMIAINITAVMAEDLNDIAMARGERKPSKAKAMRLDSIRVQLTKWLTQNLEIKPTAVPKGRPPLQIHYNGHLSLRVDLFGIENHRDQLAVTQVIENSLKNTNVRKVKIVFFREEVRKKHQEVSEEYPHLGECIPKGKIHSKTLKLKN